MLIKDPFIYMADQLKCSQIATKYNTAHCRMGLDLAFYTYVIS